MIEQPLVSVIIATYNSSKFIKKALDSVISQKCEFKFEILIGDDCSNDKTRDILENYKDYNTNIHLYFHKENVGAAQNYFFLLSKARGKYIALLDGDDYWTDVLKLAKQVNFLENNPEYIGCTHKFVVVDENDNPIKKQKIRFVKQKKKFTFKCFAGYYLPGQPSTFLRRNIFLDKENLNKLSDCISVGITDRFSMALFLSKGYFGFIDEFMGAYRICQSSMTTKCFAGNGLEFEYKLTCQLEKFCSNLFNKKIVFNKYKREIYLNALYGWIKGDKSLKNVLCSTYKDISNPFYIFIYVPIWCINKIVVKFECSR